MTTRLLALALGLALLSCGPEDDTGSPNTNTNQNAAGPLEGCLEKTDAELGLPALNAIAEASFSKPYSCEGGYPKSALFLSGYSKERNAPELLYDAACGSDPVFQVAAAGDGYGFIADLGEVSLETVSAHVALTKNMPSSVAPSFKNSVPAVAGHTYSVMVSTEEVRALFAFRAESVTKDGPAAIRFAVLNYGVNRCVARSPGFEWEKANR